MISHRSVANYAFNVNEVLLKDVARVDFSTNIAFDLTLTTTVCALLLGKTIFVYTGELSDVDSYAQHLVGNSIDFVKSTPSLLANLNLGYFTEHKIKQAFIGGEKLEKLQLEHISRYVNHPIDEYGPTEATVGTTYIDKSAAQARGIGKPYFNYKVYVLDHSLRPVPVGVKGQL
jgi:non-ribosomal peptide synthetase component F